MSFGGGGDLEEYTPIGPGNKRLGKYMSRWRKEQQKKQGMESTILTSWSGAPEQMASNTPKTILGEAWLTK